MELAERVRRVFSARGLTLYRVSRESARIFGGSSRFFVPHNLYRRVAVPSVLPGIHQMLALSHITDYRLSDWLKVFGIDLDSIVGLQSSIPRRRTALLDATVYDTEAWIPWFADRTAAGVAGPIAPLGTLLAPWAPVRAGKLIAPDRGRFVYGMVGQEDAHALPHFVPGSIVRVDTRRAVEARSEARTGTERPFFLVEGDFGFTCSQLVPLSNNMVQLRPAQGACGVRELRIGREVRIHGAVDAEIRPLAGKRDSQCPRQPVARRGQLGPWPQGERQPKDLLCRARLNAGLSFREASALSRLVAQRLSDEVYFVAPSTLSDYETLAEPPRHIQKILTLSLVYGVGFRLLLEAWGLPLGREGNEAIPEEILPRPATHKGTDRRSLSATQGQPDSDFLESLLRQGEEVPLFLRSSLEHLAGIRNLSLSDIFWVSENPKLFHPLLNRAVLMAVNRRTKRPMRRTARAHYSELLYLLLKRDGTYLCNRCVLDRGDLVIPSYSRGLPAEQRLRDGIDAEVIGRVTAILRRFPQPGRKG